MMRPQALMEAVSVSLHGFVHRHVIDGNLSRPDQAPTGSSPRTPRRGSRSRRRRGRIKKRRRGDGAFCHFCHFCRL